MRLKQVETPPGPDLPAFELTGEQIDLLTDPQPLLMQRHRVGTVDLMITACRPLSPAFVALVLEGVTQ